MDTLDSVADRQEQGLSSVLNESTQIACTRDAEEASETSEKSTALDRHWKSSLQWRTRPDAFARRGRILLVEAEATVSGRDRLAGHRSGLLDAQMRMKE
jgi:hypothetical protein